MAAQTSRARQLVVTLVLLGCTPAPPWPPAPVPWVEAAACPEGLAELGLAAAPSSRDVSARYRSFEDSTVVMFDQGPVRYAGVEGVGSVSALMVVGGIPPARPGTLQLDVMVTSPAPRTFAQRQLTIDRGAEAPVVVDPSVTGAVPALSRAGAVVERLIFLVPPETAVALASRPAIAGSIGATRLRLSDRERDGIRALLLYVICGPANAREEQR